MDLVRTLAAQHLFGKTGKPRDYTSHTEAINAANHPQEELADGICPNCDGQCEPGQPCAKCNQPPDTSVSILAALKFAGTEHEAEAAANLLRNAADYIYNDQRNPNLTNQQVADMGAAVDLLDDLRDTFTGQMTPPTWLVRLFPAVPA